jgi:hypothetical protein
MFASLNPASVSPIVTTPVNGSTVSMMSATTSIRGRFITNMTTAATSKPRMSANSVFMELPD